VATPRTELELKARSTRAIGYATHRPVAGVPIWRCEPCDVIWPCAKAAAGSRRYFALAAIPEPPRSAGVPDLTWYDQIIIESSGGKDSQAMLDYVWALAGAQGVLGRVVVVHADLGEVEWDQTVDLGEDWFGTADLARRQAEVYGLRFVVVQRSGKDGKPDTLLDQIERRGKFPDARNRYCTSDQKRAPARALMTRLAGEQNPGRPVRILNCLGMRGQESCRRETMAPFELDEGATSPTTKWVWRWLPIHAWTVDQVWERNLATGVPIHPIYARGLSRASCSFCILASKDDLLRAVELRPDLAARYAALEKRIGHQFRHKQPMSDLIEAAAVRALTATGGAQ
jgi:3'-phosphoadenosine 5'-phosphosulfate sulfotransferase (PAPS reductase)/FAD synthetase